MHFKGLLQVFGRLWLMEESQALYWANIAQQILVSKSLDAAPGFDPRIRANHFDARGNQAYPSDIFRVDEKANLNPKGPVQVVKLDGPLMEEDFCGAPGMMTMQQAIRSANADPEIQSLVLYINSPGGTAAGTENLANEFSKSKKPKISYIKNYMCSAAYWAGSGADEIIADDENGGYNTMIGSIGVKAVLIDDSKQLEQRGIRIIEVPAEQSTRKGKYNSDLLSGDFTRLKEELKHMATGFINAVKENRGDKLKLDQENVLDGETYNVKEAIKYGLVDRAGSFSTAVKRSLMLAKTIK